MSGPWEDFQSAPESGQWNDFAPKTKPPEFSGTSWKDFLKAELENTDAGTRNIAGFGTALSNLVEGTKQLVGYGDKQKIEANKIIEEAAPGGAILGNAAMTAIPFGLVGNSVKGAAAVGAGINALQPADSLLERGKNAAIGGLVAGAGQKVANVSGEWLANKLQNLSLAQTQKAPLQQTIQEGVDAGFVFPPSAINPTLLNNVRDSIGGKIATAQTASNRNALAADALARKAVGLAPDEPLTSQAMKQIRESAFKTGYEPIAQVGPMPTDGAFVKALDDIASKFTGPSQSFPGAIKSEVPELVNAFKVQGFDAGQALQATKVLREQASDAFRAGDSAMGQARRKIADELENQIERNLTAAGASGSSVLQNFREARKLMAKSHTVEDAIVEGSGSVNPAEFAKALKNGVPLEGDLLTIAKIANNFPKAMQPAKQVQGPAISKLNAAGSAGFGAAGALLGGFPGVAAAAIPFVAPAMARTSALSRSSQNALARQMFELGITPRVSNALLQYAPVGGTVAALEALRQ